MGAARRERLDVALVRRGLCASRREAQAAILAGHVTVAGRRVDKPGTPVPEDAPLAVSGPAHPYASRGGLKLAAALDRFGLDPRDWAVIDVGASTGGFTDVWLRRGARRVVAVDVGRGQLLPRLAADPRVVVRDRTNARRLRLEDVGGEPADAASVDVSFIGLELVVPAVVACLKPGGHLLALVKPQFEVGRGRVGKGGVVRRPEDHAAVLARLVGAAGGWGVGVEGVMPSPVLGAEGNREFFLWARRGSPGRPVDVAEAVAEAWARGGQDA
ncbi:MAG: TlyA family RNA methyltransferase [Actinomycetia bacterium]|nr:TlyA family RNA methyltransferase [Actinomycetes bacterium]